MLDLTMEMETPAAAPGLPELRPTLGNISDFQWSPEDVTRLRIMWEGGRSASIIANEFGGGMTRNAVLGKIWRLGYRKEKTTVSLRNTSPWLTRRDEQALKEAKIKKMTDRAEKEKQRKELEQNRRKQRLEAALVPDDPIIDVNTPLPTSRLVKLLALRDGLCHWPLGDPLSKSFSYCGADSDIGRTYCPGHMAMAYYPPQRRLRNNQLRSPARVF